MHITIGYKNTKIEVRPNMLREGERKKLMSRDWNVECGSMGRFYYQLAVGMLQYIIKQLQIHTIYFIIYHKTITNTYHILYNIL